MYIHIYLFSFLFYFIHHFINSFIFFTYPIISIITWEVFNSFNINIIKMNHIVKIIIKPITS